MTQWKLVPVEPTPEIINAIYVELGKDEKIPVRRAWAAALASAPEPAQEPVAEVIIDRYGQTDAALIDHSLPLGTKLYAAPSPSDARDAARYRWLRNGNAVKPEEAGVYGGEDLDEMCDFGIAAEGK